MNNTVFEWNSCKGNVSEDRINYIHSIIGINLPVLYLEIIKNCDGGTPVFSDFSFLNNSLNIKITDCIGSFLTLNDSEYTDFLKEFFSPPDFFPKGLISFAVNGGGDFICFDYRDRKNLTDPQIVYWSHEADIGEDVSFIANNFEEFLNILEKPLDEDA